MKIALVVPGGFERPDGPEPPRRIPALHALVLRLTREHEVHVFCTDFDERAGDWRLLEASVHDPGRVAPSRVPFTRTAQRAWRLTRGLDRASKQVRFDVVHAFWADANGLAAVFASRRLGIPLVASLGGGECVSLPDIGYGNARTGGGRMTARTVFAAAQTVTAGSRDARRSVPCKYVEIVPLGADRELFDGFVERLSGPPWRLIHVASRNAVKDPFTMLSTLRVLVDRGMDVRLEWFGGDTLNGTVEQKATTLGLADRIAFRGEQSSTQVAHALRSAHLHVMSSRHESQCVAVLEAALAGVATVGTRVGTVADLAPHAALATPVADAEALAGGVAALLHDLPRRLALAEAAQRYARLHDASWTASMFTSLYRRISAAKSNHRLSSGARHRIMRPGSRS